MSEAKAGDQRDAWTDRMKVLGRAQARYLWLLLLFGLFFAALQARRLEDTASAWDALKVPVVDLEIAASTVQSTGPALISFLLLAMMGSLRAYTRAREAAGLEGDQSGLTEALDSTPNAIDLALYTTQGSPKWIKTLLYFGYPTILTAFVSEVAWLWWADLTNGATGVLPAVLRGLAVPLWLAATIQVGMMWARRVVASGEKASADTKPQGGVGEARPQGDTRQPKVPFTEVVRLYQFYVDSYIKALWFYLAVNGALITAALTTNGQDLFLGLLGLGVAAVGLIPIVYCHFHERSMRQTLRAYRVNHGTDVVHTGPLRMLWWGVSAFWALTVAAWVWVLRHA